jgi:hypothetical protein
VPDDAVKANAVLDLSAVDENGFSSLRWLGGHSKCGLWKTGWKARSFCGGVGKRSASGL